MLGLFFRPKLPDYIFDFGYVILGSQATQMIHTTNTGWWPVSFKVKHHGLRHLGFFIEVEQVRNLPGHETVDIAITFDPKAANLPLGPVEAQVNLQVWWKNVQAGNDAASVREAERLTMFVMGQGQNLWNRAVILLLGDRKWPQLFVMVNCRRKKCFKNGKYGSLEHLLFLTSFVEWMLQLGLKFADLTCTVAMGEYHSLMCLGYQWSWCGSALASHCHHAQHGDFTELTAVWGGESRRVLCHVYSSLQQPQSALWVVLWAHQFRKETGQAVTVALNIAVLYLCHLEIKAHAFLYSKHWLIYKLVFVDFTKTGILLA